MKRKNSEEETMLGFFGDERRQKHLLTTLLGRQMNFGMRGKAFQKYLF